MSEIERVLKPGGFAHIATPFCHPFHEYPKDCRRFTPDGLEEIGGNLKVVAKGWRTGPAAAMLVFSIEYMKMICRGGGGGFWRTSFSAGFNFPCAILT